MMTPAASALPVPLASGDDGSGQVWRDQWPDVLRPGVFYRGTFLSAGVRRRTVRLVKALLTLLLPAAANHRAHRAPVNSGTTAVTDQTCVARSPQLPTVAVQRRLSAEPVVRPYLVAHEQRLRERPAQRHRRRTLWLAVHGIDAEPAH